MAAMRSWWTHLYFEVLFCHLFNANWQWKALPFMEENDIDDDADMKVLYNA